MQNIHEIGRTSILHGLDIKFAVGLLCFILARGELQIWARRPLHISTRKKVHMRENRGREKDLMHHALKDPSDLNVVVPAKVSVSAGSE